MTTPDLRHLPRSRGWPLLGSTVPFLRDPVALYRDGVARHGPVFRIDVLGRPWVVLAGPDVLAHVYLDREGIFSAQLGLRAFAPYFGGGLLHRDGDDHRLHRRTMMPAFRASAMARYLDMMNTRAANDLANWPLGRRFAVGPAIKSTTLTMAAHVFMGLDDEAEINRMNALFLTQVKGTTAPIRAALPFTAMRRGLAAKQSLFRTFGALIDQRRRAGGNDLFSQLCIAGASDWTDRDILDHFNFLLVAAHDATTAALTTMLWALARDTALQDRLCAEIDALPPGPLSIDDARGLDLTQNTFHEALRLMPPSGFTARQVTRETEWMGHRLPAGTNVVLCPGPVMLSPEYWRDPLVFDPDRFGPDRAEHQAHSHVFSPFGGGAHKCIGLHFAGLQVKAVIVALLRRSRVTMAPDDDPSWRQMPTPTPRNGLPVTLRPR